MAGERYTQKFKVAAVKQITQEGHSTPDIADLSPELVPS
jgi:hypothetical protein